MYAVVKSGGKQYRVAQGDTLQVDRTQGEAGSELVLDQVLMVGGDAVKVGCPTVEGARVVAKIVSHDQGDKVMTFKYKRRKRSRKHRGFRSSLTTLEIVSIEA